MELSLGSQMIERLQSLIPGRVLARIERDFGQSWQPPALDRRGRLVAASSLVLASIAILFARRPDQFLHPYIWVEEGLYTLRFYAERGWITLFHPLSGYLMLASKLITLTAFQLSILWAPQILAALTIAFTCAIALSPTHLKWPYACALAALLVPSNPEVFGTGHYTFWWAGLLLPLTVLWTDERQWLRLVYLLFAGVSSPLIGGVAVLLAVRLALERNRREMIATLVAGAACVVQILGMRAEAAIGVYAVAHGPTPAALPVIVQKYVGAFFHLDTIRGGLAIAAALAVLTWAVRSRLDRYFALMVLVFVGFAIMITMRLQPGELDVLAPLGAGPRYFFYPFVLLSWILIWLASVSPRPVQAFLAASFVATLVAAGPALSRRHDTLDWKREVLACAQADQYELPIHFAGSSSEMWHLKLSGAQCRALLARSLF
jgi:hypothetical protein